MLLRVRIRQLSRLIRLLKAYYLNTLLIYILTYTPVGYIMIIPDRGI